MSWLIDRIVKAILDWLLSKGIRLRQTSEADQAIDEQARESADALKKATTDEEFDRAAQDVLHR